MPVILCLMRTLGIGLICCLAGAQGWGATVSLCSDGAKTFLPCELKFQYEAAELQAGTDPYRGETLHVEFRSPNHKTYLIRTYAVKPGLLVARFSPTEPGIWSYHTTGPLLRYNNQESTFAVNESGLPGFVGVANVRHWWTTNKQPHLWLSAEAPLLQVDSGLFVQWLDARQHDGFTHIRGVVLSGDAPQKPLKADGTPNEDYFGALDERLLAAAGRGFVLDLVLADVSFLKSNALDTYDVRDPLLRYLVARYGALDVTWQGISRFEEVPEARALLKSMAEELNQYDMFRHPRSTDARDSSSPLLPDGWLNFLMEGSAVADLGAIEHQFTQAPQIHVVSADAPDAFRHEIWNAATNGEYLCVPYRALENAANVKAVQIWARVLSDTRHWELEPYFEVDGARAVGLTPVEYLAYAQTPGIVEINLPKHKYNPLWINPITGEELELKDYKGEVFSRSTPDTAHDWILQVPREGHKEMMLRSYRFESQDPPVQEPEVDPAKTPFTIADPTGDSIHAIAPPPYSVKLTRSTRATRSMQYVWWGEIVAGSEGARLLGVGAKGTFQMPLAFQQPGVPLNVRLLGMNANGKAYEMDRVYQITQ